MSGVDDLVQWLRDQLDAEQAAARRASEHASATWRVDDDEETLLLWDPMPETPGMGHTIGWRIVPHIAEHDPARVLREIDAKRQMVADLLAERHEDNEEDHWYACAALTDEDGDPVCGNDARAPGPCDCGRDERVRRYLHLLALPYSDRPGYREEWRPSE